MSRPGQKLGVYIPKELWDEVKSAFPHKAEEEKSTLVREGLTLLVHQHRGETAEPDELTDSVGRAFAEVLIDEQGRVKERRAAADEILASALPSLSADDVHLLRQSPTAWARALAGAVLSTLLAEPGMDRTEHYPRDLGWELGEAAVTATERDTDYLRHLLVVHSARHPQEPEGVDLVLDDLLKAGFTVQLERQATRLARHLRKLEEGGESR